MLVKSDKDLFEDWIMLSEKIKLTGAGIVQNDMDLELKDILEWREDIQKLINDILILRTKTFVYMTGGDVKED